MNTIELMLEASKLAVAVLKGYPQSMAREDALITLRNAIAAGEAELAREPDAQVCDCEGTTDDDGRPLHYALLYLPHPLPPETKLYLREETK